MNRTHDPKLSTGARILVVEDEPLFRKLLALVLRENGYQVELAENGVSALKRLETEPLPDLILLDLQMPELNGAGFRAAQLRSPRLACIPLIVCSGAPAASHQEHFRNCPWMEKPIDIAALLSAVAASLAAKSSAPYPNVR